MTKSTSNDALYITEDLLNRSFIPFFLLGKTAKTIMDNFGSDLDGDITIGILRKHYTKSGKSALKMLLPRDTNWGENELTFLQGGIPVSIKIIDRNYSFFNHPDRVIHKISDFCVPNPFNKYWRTRNLIQ